MITEKESSKRNDSLSYIPPAQHKLWKSLIASDLERNVDGGTFVRNQRKPVVGVENWKDAFVDACCMSISNTEP